MKYATAYRTRVMKKQRKMSGSERNKKNTLEFRRLYGDIFGDKR